MTQLQNHKLYSFTRKVNNTT